MSDVACSLCGWRELGTEAGWLPVPGLEGGKLHAQLPPEKLLYCDFHEFHGVGRYKELVCSALLCTAWVIVTGTDPVRILIRESRCLDPEGTSGHGIHCFLNFHGSPTNAL